MSRDIVQEKVIDALQGALQQAKRKGQLKVESLPSVTLDQPKRPEWGDLASTVAMTLASSEQRAPHDVAQIILDNIVQREAIFDRVEIARPGFLNMTVKRDLWLQVLSEIEAEGEAYGRADVGKGRRVLVEYVSANPTGPLHVGHGRGAAVGQAIARLLTAAGFDVVQEYYVNDAGRQMKLLGASVYARYLEQHGRAVAFPEDGYRGDYIATVAAHVRDRVGTALLDAPAEQAEQRCQELAHEELLGLIRQDLQAFGIEFDAWFSEASLVSSGAVRQVLDDLKQRDLLFEQDGALWFRSSAFGDEKDRVVRKQEGDYTYLAADVAYHRDKLMRGYDLLVDVWGADHHGYIPRMEAVVQAYGHPKDHLRVVLVQMVNLMRGGQKVEMSKRAGEFITLREVVDEVGADAAKFFFLMRRSDTHLDFDLELAKQRSADNPVYYVQYAHARIASLFRVADERGIAVPKPSEVDLRLLKDPDEFGLIRKLSAYPAVVQASAAALEPHRLTFYLQELAGLLHTFYYKHRIMPPAAEAEVTDTEGFVKEPGALSVRQREEITPGLTAARLALMREVQQVLRNGLTMLGLSAPDRM
ncbi:MAG: arginine--tRNA ligase [Nitrospirae bacterium]|nr:arginine--tRNA ligase [Nitrospirota bacterium]